MHAAAMREKSLKNVGGSSRGGVFMVEGEMEGEMSIGMRKYDARVLVSGRT